MSDAATIAALAGLAGMLALDATAALQVMISQPVVAGALAGLVCGDVGTGTLIGAVLQLIWLGALPVGSAGFPDAPVGTVVAVGLASLLSKAGVDPAWSWALGVASGLIVGAVGRSLVAALRRFNVRLSEEASARAMSGEASGVAMAVGAGLLLRFAAGAALAGLCLATAPALLRLIQFAPVRGGFPAFLWAAPVAAAVVARTCRGTFERGLLAAGFLAGLLLVAGR